ncbi:MAG: acetyl-CoA carboxylase biotin carboxyl carrier protein subunit [Thermotogae bacterium]|nr:acetyl-CoA carboxylase biotin carboxyl carrier protein subunit [Thermotogota bacterium]
MKVKRYGRWYLLNGKRFAFRRVKGGYEVLYEGRHHFVATDSAYELGETRTRSKEDEIEAPMAGRIVSVRVKENDEVKEGDVLVVLEAMKMELMLSAPRSGRVAEVRVKEGEVVQQGQTLVRLD